MLERLELTEAINALAVFPQNFIGRDGLSGEELTRVPYGEDFVARFKYRYATIQRSDLLRTLVDAARKQPSIRLSTSMRVTGFEQLGDRVIVETQDGGAREGCALVGADGLWSRVRGQLLGDGEPRVSGHIAYRAVVPTSKVPEHLHTDDVVIWVGPRTHLVHYPLRRGDFYNLVAVFHSDRYEKGWDTYGDPEELRQSFRGQRPEVLDFLALVEDWRMWVLCDREPVSRWSEGRVTLLGDAAHPMLQYLAQGGAMAIEDAVVLADHVTDARGDFAAAFLEYQKARYLRTTRVQVTARLYGELFHATDAVRDLRRALLAGRTPEQHYAGLAWLYDYNPFKV